MTTQTSEAKINRNAVTAIATTIAKGLATVNGTGSLLTQVCKVARSMFKGKPIPKVDIDAILDDLVSRMGWKGPTADVRRSEYKSVLAQYDKLEEAMEAFKKRSGKCTWHDGIALSRLLKSNPPSKAAIAHGKRGHSGTTTPGHKVPRADAKKRVAVSVKSLLKLTKLEREFRDALAELCGEFGIKI